MEQAAARRRESVLVSFEPERHRDTMAVQLNGNNYNGRRYLQIELLDWRTAE